MQAVRSSRYASGPLITIYLAHMHILLYHGQIVPSYWRMSFSATYLYIWTGVQLHIYIYIVGVTCGSAMLLSELHVAAT